MHDPLEDSEWMKASRREFRARFVRELALFLFIASLLLGLVVIPVVNAAR